MLTMALLIMESKEDLPKIGYLTALDIYLIVCFLFILSSVFEFACVHYETKFIYEQDLFILYRLMSLNKRIIKQHQSSFKKKSRKLRSKYNYDFYEDDDQEYFSDLSYSTYESIQNENDDLQESIDILESMSYKHIFDNSLTTDSIPVSRFESNYNCLTNFFSLFSLDYFREKLNLVKNTSSCSMRNNENLKFKIINRVSKIDRYSRVLYPVCFSFFNLFYWKFYLNQRDHELYFS